MSDGSFTFDGKLPDYLIVGGGSSGCVLASRLSENPDVTVLLIEAGPDLREESVPTAIRSAYPSKAFFTREYFYPDLKARQGDVATARSLGRPAQRYEQAKVLGGGSTINGMIANRGAPSDYDAWGALGAEGWNWATVLPYFRKLEHDLDFDGEHHGKDGPVPIRRQRREVLSGFVQKFFSVLKSKGYDEVDDQNGAWRDGVMRVTTNITPDETRASAAICYLSSKVRARPNLRVVTETTVLRLLAEEGRVVGVEIGSGTGSLRVLGRETLVCCGTINTPALLMRSGFGPADVLAGAGVPVVCDIPGVGRNLQEHPALGISCFLKPAYRHMDQTRHHTQAHLRFSSKVGDCPTGDMTMALLARSAWHGVGGQLGTFYLWINKAYSEGRITIRTADPLAPPEIDFHLLSDDRDLKRMRDGFRHMAGLLLDPGFDEVRHEVFPTMFSDRVRAVSRPTRWNAFQTSIFATILDWFGFARAKLIKTFIAPFGIHDLLNDEKALDEFLHRSVVGVWHPVGTCRMGGAEDPSAVTGPTGKVHNVPGLRIGDASLMPTIPCGNTNIPTIMVAERLADLIKNERAEPEARRGVSKEIVS